MESRLGEAAHAQDLTLRLAFSLLISLSSPEVAIQLDIKIEDSDLI